MNRAWEWKKTKTNPVHTAHILHHTYYPQGFCKTGKCWCRNRRQQSKRDWENGKLEVRCWLCHLLVAWSLVGHWTLMSKCSCLRNGSIAAPASVNYMDHMGTVSPQVVGAHWTPVELSFKREAAWLFLRQQLPACSSSTLLWGRTPCDTCSLLAAVT